MRPLLTILVVFLTACATPPTSPIVPNVLVADDKILIRGAITKETASEFKRAIESAKISKVMLDSGGGNVEAAIEIATLIHKRELDVEVVKNCFSSCANYLFTAGKNKHIGEQGIVAWHGNAHHMLYLHKTGQKPLNESEFNNFTRLVKLEADFFASIATDQFICWFGKLEPFKIRNLYFLSKQDMERFGVKNITVRSNYEASDTSYLKAWWGMQNLTYLAVDWNTYTATPPRF